MLGIVMNTYGWFLLAQTLLALVGLGLAGGWALIPFRRQERPYLWLAAPLAGLFTFGASLAICYFVMRMPLQWSIGIGLFINIAATTFNLRRLTDWQLTRARFGAALLVTIGSAYWANQVCNKTAILHREPTIAVMDGSDMFGYAVSGDWLRNHPASERPRVDRPFETIAYGNICYDTSRPIAHLLGAAGAEVRGTTALFSYDWTSGVILAAGMLGFGGLFASNSLWIFILPLGVGLSNWITNSRTGYLGKSLAYPGGMLLASFFLETISRPSRGRIALLAGFGFAIGYSLNPKFTLIVFGIVVASYLGSLLFTFIVSRWYDRSIRFIPDFIRPARFAILLYMVTAVPGWLLYHFAFTATGFPESPHDWTFVIPVSLDLEKTSLVEIKPKTQQRLKILCLASLVIAMGIAIRQRNRAAIALIGCALLVPFAWLIGEYRLYAFHGLLYPLTLAGASLLAEPWLRQRHVQLKIGLLALLLLGMIGLRVPQCRTTADRYLFSAQPFRAVIRQSEAVALRAAIGSESVDVILGQYPDNHFVLAELCAQGAQIQFRSPTWERSIYAYTTHCPDLLTSKSRYTLVERNAYAPTGSVRYVGHRLKLCEDFQEISVMGFGSIQELVWHPDRRPGFWIGNAPSNLQIHNGTRRPATIQLQADTQPGPAHPKTDQRTLRYRLGDQTGRVVLGPKNWVADLQLDLTPGLNLVELSIEEKADPAPKEGAAVLLLTFMDWRIKIIKEQEVAANRASK